MFINHLCECEVRAASVRIAKVEFSKTLMMSRPRSWSDPIGESEPVSGCETIYWDFVFFFYQQSFTFKNELPPEWYPLKFIHIY